MFRHLRTTFLTVNRAEDLVVTVECLISIVYFKVGVTHVVLAVSYHAEMLEQELKAQEQKVKLHLLNLWACEGVSVQKVKLNFHCVILF